MTGCNAKENGVTAKHYTITNNISETAPDTYKRSTPYSSPENVIDNTTPDEYLADNTRRVAKITNLIHKIEGVNNANVVLTDKTALIGITVKNSVEEKDIPALKRSIEKVTLDADSKLELCSVTTAPDLVQRIGNIAGNETDGITSDEIPDDNNFSEGFKSLIRRATPTI